MLLSAMNASHTKMLPSSRSCRWQRSWNDNSHTCSSRDMLQKQENICSFSKSRKASRRHMQAAICFMRNGKPCFFVQQQQRSAIIIIIVLVTGPHRPLHQQKKNQKKRYQLRKQLETPIHVSNSETPIRRLSDPRVLYIKGHIQDRMGGYMSPNS